MRAVDHDQTSDTFDKSQLRRWCIGIVAETKPDDIDEIKVYPVEHLSMEEGGVLEEEPVEATMPDKDGIIKTTSTERKRWQEARWKSEGDDGRQSAPDVVAGETVQLYRYGNSETVYWNTIFRERSLRRLEHVVHAFSNLKEGREEFGLESSYGHTFSTKRKYIQIWTTKSDGEAFEYAFTIRTDESTVRLKDDINNMFEIESPIHRVRCINADGTFTDHIGPDLHALAPALLTHTSKQQIDTSGIVIHQTPLVQNTGSMETAGVHRVGSIITGSVLAQVLTIGGPGGPGGGGGGGGGAGGRVGFFSTEEGEGGEEGGPGEGGGEEEPGEGGGKEPPGMNPGGGRDVGAALEGHDDQIEELQHQLKLLQDRILRLEGFHSGG